MSELKKLFDKFKSKYHTAVVKGEALDHDDSGSLAHDKKSREAWAEAQVAEQEFLEALARVDV